MPRFDIMTPGGYEIEVSADTEEQALNQARSGWKSMPRIILKEGSMRVYERPNGDRYLRDRKAGYSATDPAIIDKVMSGTDAARASRSVSNEQVLAQFPWASKGVEFLRGLPFVGSYTDEALGAVFGEKAGEAVRTVSGAMQEERPGQTLALNLAGGLTGSVGAALAAPGAIGGAVGTAIGKGSRGAQMARGLAAGAAAGGTEGAIYGAGEGADAQSRMGEAGRGAKIGATVGGALGAAAPLAKEAVENVVSLFRRSDIRTISKELGISQDAAKVIKNTFERGGDVQSALVNLERAGGEAMLVDAGRAAQALLNATAASGAGAASDVSAAITKRSERSAEALGGAMDETLGFPTDVEALQRGIRTGTAPSRSAAYDAALSQEIDWRSPAGEQLRMLLETTPSDVMAKAARLKSMDEYGDILPDYSGDFASDVRSASWATPEAQEVKSFFDEYDRLAVSVGMKRPLTAQMKAAGGIDPAGEAAEELRARGVTPRTHPGLFRRGGLQAVDNLEIDQFPESMRFGKETGVYADPEDIYQGLVDEGRGVAVGSAEEAAAKARIAEMEALLPEYTARRDEIMSRAEFATAPEAMSEAFPVKTVADVNYIKLALDDIARTGEGAGLMGGTTTFGRSSKARAKKIRDALVEAVPEYGVALETASDAISRIEAVQMGADLLKPSTTRDAVAEFMRGASGGEKMAVQSGLRGQIEEIMANARAVASDPNQDVREAITALNRMNTRASRDKISLILGDAAPEFLKKLDEASATMSVRAAMAANSETAIRQATQADVGQITAPGLMGQAGKGEAPEAMKTLVQAVTGMTDEYSARRRQEIYSDIAKALTEKTGDDARAALAMLDNAMRGQTLTDAETDFIAKVVAGTAFVGGTSGVASSAASERRRAQPLRIDIPNPGLLSQ